MFSTNEILSKLRAQGAPAGFLKTAAENLPAQGLTSQDHYLLIGQGHVRTSNSGELHQGKHNYYVLPLSFVRESVTPSSGRAA